MRRSPLLSALLVVALSTTVTAPASATVMAPVTVDALAQDSELVLVVTPMPGRRAFWRQGRIFTDVTCVATAVLKGSVTVGARVTVRLPGGVVGDVTQALAGAPALEDGVPVVVFLSPDREGVRTVNGLSAGVLPLSTTPTGTVVVTPARTDGITFLPSPTTPHPRITVPPEGMALERLAALLREVIR